MACYRVIFTFNQKPIRQIRHGCRLEDLRGFISGGCSDFSLRCHAQSGSGTHPVSSLMGTGALFCRWCKRHEADAHYVKWDLECPPLVCSRGVVFNHKDRFIYHLYKYMQGTVERISNLWSQHGSCRRNVTIYEACLHLEAL